MVVSRSLTRKSVCTSPTRLKNLSGDAEVAGTVRYCLAIRAKSGNSCWCCFHQIRGSVSHHPFLAGCLQVQSPTHPHLRPQIRRLPFMTSTLSHFLVNVGPLGILLEGNSSAVSLSFKCLCSFPHVILLPLLVNFRIICSDPVK